MLTPLKLYLCPREKGPETEGLLSLGGSNREMRQVEVAAAVKGSSLLVSEGSQGMGIA